MENLEAAIWPIFFGSVGSQYAQFGNEPIWWNQTPRGFIMNNDEQLDVLVV